MTRPCHTYARDGGYYTNERCHECGHLEMIHDRRPKLGETPEHDSTCPICALWYTTTDEYRAIHKARHGSTW